VCVAKTVGDKPEHVRIFLDLSCFHFCLFNIIGWVVTVPLSEELTIRLKPTNDLQRSSREQNEIFGRGERFG
jgi:hypothetical protein